MSYQGRLWVDAVGAFQVGRVKPDVQAGDLCAFTVAIEGYLLREGQTSWSPADLIVPPGWTLVDWWVAIPGGDPRRIALVQAVIARIADAATAGALVEVRSAVPHYAADQDPGSGAVMMDFTTAQSHGGRQWSGWWRGEQGIGGVDRVVVGSPVHEAVLPSGSSRDGAASVARWASWVMGGGSWVSLFWRAQDAAESPTNRDVSGANPIVSAQGPAGSVFARLSNGNANYDAPGTGTVQLHAVSATAVTYPLPPVMTAPDSGALLDLERDGLTVAWRHRASLAGPQAGWALSRVRAGVTQWWQAAGSAWSSSPVTNSGATWC